MRRPELAAHLPLTVFAVAALGAVALPLACSKPTPDEIVTPATQGETSVASAGSGLIATVSGAGSGGGAAPSSSTATATGATSTAASSATGGPPPFTKAALLEATADCAIGRYRAFETHAKALRDATATNAAAPSETNRARAQLAWLDAITTWQEAELFQFGPAASTPAKGAKNLRDEIYAWPLFSRCGVDELVVSQGYASLAGELVNRRGLGAIEYLLVHAGPQNGCSQFSDINADGTWAALSTADLASRRAAYASAATSDVLGRAQALVAAWDPAGGNFRREFTLAGAGSATYATEQEALNAVAEALFYVDGITKDLKLGKPLGILECLAAACPEALESQYARVSLSHVRSNLRGVRRLFEGCSGPNDLGFDDWLRAAGAEDIAAHLLDALAGAEAAIDGLAPSLEDVVANDRAKGVAAHAALKKFTDLLKTEFVTTLNLELPKSIEGDND